ncbi:MAG: metallophosphoesterase [Cyanobacteria bacterium HKST-UBA05]|nr:metallophosphoesterase [Cyanobacteria bacterium HKST-UBA05]
MLPHARNAFVLSDIHLGAATSLLTAYDASPEGQVERRVSAKLFIGNLLDLLREQIGSDGPIDQCILLGDIFDFSFASYGLAMKNGYWFFQELAKSGLFKTFVYIPGNHDHHLWQQLIEHQFVLNSLYQPAINHPKTLPPYELIKNTFLDELVPSDFSIAVTYPNYGVFIGGRPILFHHGHFLQPLYSAASQLLSDVLETKDIEDLEAFNAPFLEFGWYNLGQAFNVGEYKLVDRLYHNVKSKSARDWGQAINRVLRLLIGKLEAWESQRISHPVKRKLLQTFFSPLRWVYHRFLQLVGPLVVRHFVMKRVRLFEQHMHASTARHEPVGNSLKQTITDYIKRYLLSEVNLADDHHDMVFIFGHTHEPANDIICRLDQQKAYATTPRSLGSKADSAETSQAKTLHLYNTGGWMVDQLTESDSLVIPKMNPLYIDPTGQIHSLPFLQTNYEFIEHLLETDPVYIKLKAQLASAAQIDRSTFV